MTRWHWRGRNRAGWLAIFAALPFLVAPGPGLHDEPLGGSEPSPRPGAALLGEWWTENNEGRVRFTADVDGTYRGTTTCCSPRRPSPENPATDIHNPDPKLRGRSTVGIVIIWKLAYEDGEYEGGYVYNPRDGKTYRFAAELLDHDSVEVRGYIGIPLLGQSQVWKRVRAPRPAAAR